MAAGADDGAENLHPRAVVAVDREHGVAVGGKAAGRAHDEPQVTAAKRQDELFVLMKGVMSSSHVRGEAAARARLR